MIIYNFSLYIIMTKRKTKSRPSKKPRKSSKYRQQEPDIFTGTKKLVDSAICAYKVGGMPLVLVIIGLIGFIFSFLFKSMFEGITFIIMVVVSILLFLSGIWIYLKEKKII